MPGRIEEYSKVVSWLDGRLTGTERDNLAFPFVEVLHLEVDVSLLGTVRTGPDRRLVIRRQLEGQCWP